MTTVGLAVAMRGTARSTEHDESFTAAFQPLFLRAMHLAHRIVDDRMLAEDLAAEALARAHLHWARIHDLGHRDAWVLRVAANLAIDATRRRPPTLAPPASAGFEDAATLRVALAAALRALPRRQREVVALRYLAGFTDNEVAHALHISSGSVRTHIHRGLTALRGSLGAHFPEVSFDAD